MIVTAHQPMFLPWCGFFSKVRKADCLILLDNVPMTRTDYVNRVYVRGSNAEPFLLTIPVKKWHRGERIQTVMTDGRHDWQSRILTSIQNVYGKATHFTEVYRLLETLRFLPLEDQIQDVDLVMFHRLARYLGVWPRCVLSASEVNSAGGSQEDRVSICPSDPTDRIISLCRAVGGAEYLSGPGGKNYLVEERFEQAGIKLSYTSYEPKAYTRMNLPMHVYPPLSIIDAMMYHGKDTINLL